MARRTIVTKDNTITSQGTEPLSREVARPIFGESVLAIDYNFAEKDYLDDDITFSRASGATQTNSSGKVAFAPNNLLPHSEAFNLSDWVKYNTTATASTITDPFGGTGAFKMAEASTTATNSKLMLDALDVTSSPSGSILLYSVYAKKGELDILQLIIANGATYVGGDNHANFDLTNGAVTATSGSIVAKIESISNGWFRCSISVTIDAAGVPSPRIGIQNSPTAARDGTYAGNGTDGLYIFGAMTEQTFDKNASPSAYLKSSGGAEYGARFDFDHQKNAKGLLIEEARTNLDANSFAVGSLNQSTSFVASNEIDPSGGTSSYKVVPNTSSDFHYQYRIYNGLTNGATYTYSVYVKASGYTALILNTPSGNVNGNSGPRFDLSTGQKAPYFGTEAPCSITECGNGWYKLTSTITTNATSLRIDHGLKPTPMANAFSGDGSSGMLFWGSQLEEASFPTSLIPTYGSTADRAADIVKVDGTNFSRFFKDTEGTTVVDAQLPKGFVSDNSALFSLSDNSASDHIRMYMSASEKPVASVRTLNSGEASISTNVDVSSGEIFTSAFGYKTNDTRAFTDHGTSNKDTGVDLPTNLIELTIGHRYDNSKQLNGWIRRLRYFNKRKSDSQLQKLTSQDKLLQRFKGAKAAHSLRSLRDGRDNSAVTRIRREYDSFEADYTAAQVANGDLEKDFRSADQTTLPLDVSVEADEMIVGGDFTNLVTNGTFDTDTSGWTASNAVISSSSGQLVVDDTANAGDDSRATQAITTEVGKQYTLSFDRISTTSSFRYAIGSSDVNFNSITYPALGTTTGMFSTTFTATSTATYISMITGGSGVSKFDNVSVVEGGWTVDTGWTLLDGVATHASGTASGLDTSFNFKKGKTYDITFDVISCSGGSGSVQARGNGSTVSQTIDASTLGANTFRYTDQTNHNTLRFYAGSSTTMSIDNISVKEVNPKATGYSCRKINSSYTGYAMRVRNFDDSTEAEVSFDSNNEISLDSPVKATSMNLLPSSEDFGTNWTLDTCTLEKYSGLDPFGGYNATKITATGGAGSGPYYVLPSTAGSTHHTLSVYIKAEEPTRTRIGFFRTQSGTWVNIETDWSASGTPTTASTTNASNINYEAIGSDGWYRVSLVGITDASTSSTSVNIDPDSGGNNKSAIFYGAQLEETVYASSGSNILYNGDFELDTSWNDFGSPVTQTQSTEVVRSGTYSRKITSTASGKGTQSQQGSNGLDLTAGNKYRVSAWIYAVDGGGSANIGSGMGNTDQGVFTSRAVTEGQWTNITYDAIATASGTVATYLSFFTSGDTKTFYVDDVTVTELPVTSPKEYTQTPVISDAHNSTSATNLREFAGKENLIDYSEDFSNNYWSKIDCTAVASNVTDPLGGTSAYKITKTGTNAHLVKTSVATTGQVKSIYARTVSGTGVIDVLGGKSYSRYEVNLTEEWQRFDLVVDTSEGGGNHFYGVDFRSGDTTLTEVLLFGAQLNSDSKKDYQSTTGSAKTADVHCVVWYDQGMGEDATQSTAGNQPRIVKGAELVTDSGGKAALDFDADHDNLYIDQLAGHQRLDAYYVVDPNVTKYSLASSYNSPTAYFLIAENGSSVASKNNSGDPNYFVNGSSQSGTRDDFHDVLEGDNKVVGVTNIDTSAWANFQVGEYWTTSAASFSFGGTISEMVFFPNMDSSPKRFPIEQNMMNHYIPNLLTNGDFSDGLTGWVAGGDSSLISVENGAIRINSPDSTFTQIYQTVPVTLGRKYVITADLVVTSGGVAIGANHNSAATEVTYTSSGSISQSFVATTTSSSNIIYIKRSGASNVLIDNVKVQEVGTSGYVTTLYDQTQNNNHALQATAANQPQLVSGGDLIKSGNHPAWEHVTASNMELFGKLQAARLDAWFVADTSDQNLGDDSSRYLYPANYASSGDHGFVAQDGSSSVGITADYGGPDVELYVNGTLITGAGTTRDEVHTALNGRKLVHHQDADTADWAQLQMGYYGSSSSDWFNFEGKFSEWIWYDSDQSSNRTAIDTAINDHYNIY